MVYWFGRATSAFDRFGDRVWRAWIGVVTLGRARGARFAAIGILASAMTVALLHLMLSVGLSAGGRWLQVSVVVIALLALAVALVYLVRWYVRLRAASGDSFPLLATIVLAVFAVGLSVVAFAGLTQLLLADGVIAGAATPSLLDVEKGYLWQLVASIPLLAIPQRFGWIDPLSLTGPVAGTMLLLFKVALIAPLERV